MGKKNKKFKYLPLKEFEKCNSPQRDKMDNIHNTPNSNENPQNKKTEFNTSLNKEFGENSNSHKKNLSPSHKNEQTFKQNRNQVTDNIKVEVSIETDDNLLDQQSKNSNKSHKTIQDNTLNNTLEAINKNININTRPLSITNKTQPETAETQFTNQNTYVKQNSDYHKRNQSKKQNEIHKIDGEKCILNEIDKDLFDLSKEYALAHCVAEDLKMGAGIAIEFKDRFRGVGKLIDQKLKVGDVGIVEHRNQIAFYLITKRISSGKPTMKTLEKALGSLLDKMKELKLTKLGIPTIGCGLDGLDWSNVKTLICDIFAGSNIEISVCIPSKLLDRKAPRSLTVYISQTNLWEMQTETDIIIFIDIKQVYENNWTNDLVDKVNTRYPFKENLLKDVKNKELITGSIKQYTVCNENIICAFVDQHKLYTSIESAFEQISRSIKQLNGYLAIQSGSIQPEDNFKHIGWIVLILRSIMKMSNQCELWLCGGDEDLLYDEYCRNKWEYLKQMSYRFNNYSHSNNLKEQHYH